MPAKGTWTPRPIMEIHGTADPLIKYSGYRLWPHGAVANAEQLAAEYGCTRKKKTEPQGPGFSLIKHDQCPNGPVIQLMTIPGARHWPYKNMDTPKLCPTCSALGFLFQYTLGQTNRPDGPACDSTNANIKHTCTASPTDCKSLEASEPLNMSTHAPPFPRVDSQPYLSLISAIITYIPAG